MAENLSLFSYNSRGFDRCKQDILKTLQLLSDDNLPIICNQENFLLKGNGYMIQKCLPNHHIIFKPATKNGLHGRPKNGMFTAIPSSIKEIVKDVSPPTSRVQSIIIENAFNKIMLINTYFPQDPRCDNFDEADLLLTLSDIKITIMNHDFDQLVWAGDINADFKRNTKFVRLIEDFICEMNLFKSWDAYEIDYTHVAEKNDITYVSTIDHFFWNSTATDSIIDAGVLHLSDNFSDHCPVYCKIKTRIVKRKSPSLCPGNSNPIPCWKKATDTQKLDYYHQLQSTLMSITIPTCVLNCNDVHCKNNTHKYALDDLMLEVLHSMETTADSTMPKPVGNSNKKNSTIPNWNNEIKYFKDNAQFWHSVWLSAGKPLNTHLHMIMKRTRNIYHLQIRKNKRMLDRIKRNDLLNSCLRNNGSIFDEIKKHRKCNKTIATSIDGHNEDIPSYFASQYEHLYNSIDDKFNISEIEKNLEYKINESNQNDISMITPQIVKTASQKLKSGKTDPLLCLTSDFFVNAPPILYDLLARILKCYIMHAHVSEYLLISNLIPIVKDKLGDITCSNNYRSIAISTAVTKIFDWVIILAYNEQLHLDDLQFSYQSKVSTSMCTWLAVETISYFTRNGSDVFVCLMDMSKAFDTVKHSVLFEKLILQGLPCIVVRFILVSYQLQQANVKWNNEISNCFKIGNGVKQGAVLSAVLYCIYTNGIFEELRRQKIGCCVGQNYVGIIGYADDLLLICPSLDGLQKMLRVCEKYAEGHNLCFSTNHNPVKSKTKCMAFLRKKRDLPDLTLSGNPLPWVEAGKHLGMKIENKVGRILNQDIREKRAQYIQRNNELMQEFSFAHSSVKAKINYIYNGHFTGSVLWDLFSKEADMIYNTWNTSIRKMYRLDRKTHRYFIEPVSKIPHLKTSLLKRFLNFTEGLSNCSKLCARNAFYTLKQDCRSIIGRNMRSIMIYCGKLGIGEATTKDILNVDYQPVPIEEIWRIKFVEELLEIRENNYDLPDWNKQEVDDFIQDLCTT